MNETILDEQFQVKIGKRVAVHRDIVAKVTLPSTRFTLPLAHWQTIVAGNATTFFDECFR